MSISALTRQSHTGQKFSEKTFLWRDTALFRNIALIVHTQNFWTKFLSMYNSLLSAYMDLQKCGWKSAYFFKEKKNVKKRTKTYEKRILCKFTFIDTVRFTCYLQLNKIERVLHVSKAKIGTYLQYNSILIHNFFRGLKKNHPDT